jgi:integrase
MGPVRLPRSSTLSVEDGSWTLRWSETAIVSGDAAHDPLPRRTRIGSATGKNALTELDARRQARRYLLSRLPQETIARRSQMTLAEFIEKRFLPEFLAEKKFAWRAHYHSILRHILAPDDYQRIFRINQGRGVATLNRDSNWLYLGRLSLRDVRPLHVHQLLQAASEKGYSPQTVRLIRNFVSTVFSYARQELVFAGVNPAVDVKLARIDRSSTRIVSLEQLELVLRAMQYPEKQMAIIGLLTDMNASEICGLQWKHVNLIGSWSDSDGELIPPLALSIKKRRYRGESADVKEARRRTIRIPEMLLPMLLLLRARTTFRGPEDFVLTSRTGRAVNVSNITARRLGAISKKLGIPRLTLQALHRAHGLIEGGLGAQFQYSLGAAAASDLFP